MICNPLLPNLVRLAIFPLPLILMLSYANKLLVLALNLTDMFESGFDPSHLLYSKCSLQNSELLL